MDEGLGSDRRWRGQRGQRARGNHDTPGVNRREIAWHADDRTGLPGAQARPATGTGPIGPLPVWVDAVVLLALTVFLLAGLHRPAMSDEEAAQLSLTQDAGTLITHPASLLPGGGASAGQDAVRLAYGSITRYTAAVGWYISAGRDTARPVDLSALEDTSELVGEVQSRPVEPSHLWAARIGPALISALGVLMLFLLARRLLGRPAATVAAIVFAVQPAVLLTGRQISDSGPTLLLGLAAVFVAAGIGATLAGGEEPTLTSWTGLALWSGLCLAAGPDALPYLLGALGFVVAGLVSGARRAMTVPGGRAPLASAPPLLVAAFGAIVVWVLFSPSLWGWLPGRLSVRHAGRMDLIAAGLLPYPGESGVNGRLQAWRAVFDGPVAPGWLGGLLCLLALAGGVVLLWVVRSPEVRNLSRRGALTLLAWALLAVAWFVLWPSTQAAHQVPLLAVASLLTASLVAWLQHSAIPPLSQSRVRGSGSTGGSGGSGGADQGGDDGGREAR